MSGFSNPVVGGQGVLIRPAIRSPNYIPNLSGWSINKNGTAEFSDIIARGDIRADSVSIPDPIGIGLPFVIMDAVNGFRVFDGANDRFRVNPFTGGLVDPQASRLISLDGSAALVLSDNNQGETSLLPDATTNGINWFFGALLRGLANASTPFNRTKFQFSTGPLGSYYAAEYDITNAQVLATGVQTALTNLTSVQDHSDYAAGGMNGVTGVWTCPEDGYYGFTFMGGFTTWVAGSRLILDILNGTTGRYLGTTETAPGGALATVNTLAIDKVWINTGDTVTFLLTQVTGANRTVNTVGTKRGRITIGRKL